MELQQTTALIEQLIGQGNIEQAMDQLVVLLDSDPRYADLAQAARINQGELYQVKSQVLKGIIEPKEAQITTNKIADKALEIIRQLQAGKFTLRSGEPGPSQAWRYYVAGGVVTLAVALLLWQILGKKTTDECPSYDKKTLYQVMVLPFVQTGQDKTGDQAVDIADGIERLISKTPNLQAIAEVKVKYAAQGVENKYPSYEEAEEIARNCNVQMIIWGKINQTSTGSYTLDVRYKFLGAGQSYFSGDTSLSNLLKPKIEGQLTLDVKLVSELLYIVLANNAQAPVPANLLAMSISSNKRTGDSTAQTVPDTSTLLVYAQNYTSTKQYDKAIEAYDLILEKYPSHSEARQKRGALFYAKGDFKAAARDLEIAAPDPSAASADLLRKRVDANLKSAQPVKAQEDLKTLQEKKNDNNGTWINQKSKETQDSIVSLRKVRDKMEDLVKAEPDNKKAKMKAASANNGLGESERALKQAKSVIQIDPKNTGAVEVAVEALLQNKDTTAARKIINTARTAGANVKGIEERLPLIRPLLQPKKKQ